PCLRLALRGLERYLFSNCSFGGGRSSVVTCPTAFTPPTNLSLRVVKAVNKINQTQKQSMKKHILFGTLAFLASSLLIANAAPKDDVTAAAKKLADKDNYA